MGVKVTALVYGEACESNMGWCPECEDFTRETTEPDAEGYDCPVCGERRVVGAEWAVLTEMIEVEE